MHSLSCSQTCKCFNFYAMFYFSSRKFLLVYTKRKKTLRNWFCYKKLYIECVIILMLCRSKGVLSWRWETHWPWAIWEECRFSQGVSRSSQIQSSDLWWVSLPKVINNSFRSSVNTTGAVIWYTVRPRKNRTLKQWNAASKLWGVWLLSYIFHGLWLICFRMIHSWNSSGHASLSSIVFKIECQNPFVTLLGTCT